VLQSLRGALEAQKAELSQWIDEQQGKVSTAEKIPQAINSFREDFQRMDVRLQKTDLQTILKAAYVYGDGRIELEFRG
jgi:acyl-CoA reductase-like NAD-dependent aldehyde dehydrogenase